MDVSRLVCMYVWSRACGYVCLNICFRLCLFVCECIDTDPFAQNNATIHSITESKLSATAQRRAVAPLHHQVAQLSSHIFMMYLPKPLDRKRVCPLRTWYQSRCAVSSDSLTSIDLD